MQWCEVQILEAGLAGWDRFLDLVRERRWPCEFRVGADVAELPDDAAGLFAAAAPRAVLVWPDADEAFGWDVPVEVPEAIFINLPSSQVDLVRVVGDAVGGIVLVGEVVQE